MARVLITDDSLVMRMSLKNMMTSFGHEVVGEAENGLVAVRKYKELKPDLVTMDITMGEMNGIEAVKEIKKIDPYAKIVMCSAMGQQYLVVDSIQAGAADFIVKPFNTERVEKSIKKILEQ